MTFFSGSKPKILIIEDDPYAGDIYKKQFEKDGVKTTHFSDTDGDIVARVLEIKPDLISMDLMIGKAGAPSERDGLEAMKILKEDKKTSRMPIFVLSNFFEENKCKCKCKWGHL